MKTQILVAILCSFALSMKGQIEECFVEIMEVAPGSYDAKYKGYDDEDDEFYIFNQSRENTEAYRIYYAEYDIKAYFIWNDESEKVYACNNAFNYSIGLGNKLLGTTDDEEEAFEWMLEYLMECDRVDLEWYD